MPNVYFQHRHRCNNRTILRRNAANGVCEGQGTGRLTVTELSGLVVRGAEVTDHLSVAVDCVLLLRGLPQQKKGGRKDDHINTTAVRVGCPVGP